jgi:hypothetical protein
MKKFAAVIMTTLGLTLLGSTAPAHADADGCDRSSGIEGLTTAFDNCVNITGAGTFVNNVRVYASSDITFSVSGSGKKADLETEASFDVPTIDGCEVHASFYSSQTGVAVDSPARSCSDFESSPTFTIPVAQNVPKGKYCGTLWFKLNDRYHSAGAACKQVKP